MKPIELQMGDVREPKLTAWGRRYKRWLQGGMIGNQIHMSRYLPPIEEPMRSKMLLGQFKQEGIDMGTRHYIDVVTIARIAYEACRVEYARRHPRMPSMKMWEDLDEGSKTYALNEVPPGCGNPPDRPFPNEAFEDLYKQTVRAVCDVNHQIDVERQLAEDAEHPMHLTAAANQEAPSLNDQEKVMEAVLKIALDEHVPPADRLVAAKFYIRGE